MDNQDIQALINIRMQLISFFDNLEGKNDPAALIKQRDVAIEVAAAVSKIDDLLKGKVNFS